jgi:hypothetical protein
MHVSVSEVLTAIGVLVVIAIVVWLAFIHFHRERYTRERFAFAAMTGFFGMAGTVLVSLEDRKTPFGEILNLGGQILGHPAPAEPARTADHLLMIAVLVIVIIFVLQIYNNWSGAISVQQYTRDRYHEPSTLLMEGMVEVKRLIKREPPLELYRPEPNHSLTTALDPPESNLAWYSEALDLICLRAPSYQFDRNSSWHEGARCWVGTNRNTSQIIAIRCDDTDLSEQELVRFVEYVERLRQSDPRGGSLMELIVAIRSSTLNDSMIIRGHTVRRETSESLLEGLLDFSDYFAAVMKRVKFDPLPDSAMTLEQVYTPSSCREENGTVHTDLEAYIRAWLDEPGQRQLALLGEYGQGKSTAALMTTYHLIHKREKESRIPILIELRGKSPRNMTPEEILAAWAYPYRINPQAVMKLLAAGRLLLILEGFDEMALVGDAEARLSHFRTLWQFCYPAAKILITGRPNFFLDDDEMKAALGVSKSMAAGPYCEALHLEPFSLDQIGSALRAISAKDRHEILELADHDSKFREIVSRGSLLYGKRPAVAS